MTLSESLPELLRGTRAVEVLERSLTQNRLGHGILLHGDSFDSLEIIVRAIAAHLLNTKRDPFEHADCFTLRPSGKARLIKVGKTEDSNTMRKLVIDIAKSSNQGGRKVGIVIEADRMNAASAHAQFGRRFCRSSAPNAELGDGCVYQQERMARQRLEPSRPKPFCDRPPGVLPAP